MGLGINGRGMVLLRFVWTIPSWRRFGRRSFRYQWNFPHRIRETIAATPVWRRCGRSSRTCGLAPTAMRVRSRLKKEGQRTEDRGQRTEDRGQRTEESRLRQGYGE